MIYYVIIKTGNTYRFEIRKRNESDERGVLVAQGNQSYTTKEAALADLRDIFDLTILEE